MKKTLFIMELIKNIAKLRGISEFGGVDESIPKRYEEFCMEMKECRMINEEHSAESMPKKVQNQKWP